MSQVQSKPNISQKIAIWQAVSMDALLKTAKVNSNNHKDKGK